VPICQGKSQLQSAGVECPGDLDRLDRLDAKLRDLRETLVEYRALERERNDAEKRCTDAEKRFVQSKKESQKAQREYEVSQGEWKEWLAKSGFNIQVNPVEFEVVLQAVESARDAKGNLREWQTRVKQIKDYVSQTRTEISALLDDLGRAPASEEIGIGDLDELRDGLNTALDLQQKRSELAARIEGAESEVDRLSNQLDGKEKELDGLFELVAAATEEEFRSVGSAHAELNRYEREIETNTAALLTITGTPEAQTALERELRRSNVIGVESEQAEQRIFEIRERSIRQAAVPLKDKLVGAFDALTEKDHILGLSTGFTHLDRKTKGLHNSNLIVIAGCTSMGKTALALNIAEHVALEEKTPVGIFSLEMSVDELAKRFLASKTRVSVYQQHTDEYCSKLIHAMTPLETAGIWIDDSASLSPLELKAKARRLKASHDIGLAIVDYLQLMHVPKAENRQQEIAQISRSLKNLAKELDIPVIALSQLKRFDDRRDMKPRLSDLRESGAIEADADLVLLVWRPGYYRDRSIKVEINGETRVAPLDYAEVIVGKQRNGPTGAVQLLFLEDLARFENAEFGRNGE
jgi:replicative DNA helicase